MQVLHARANKGVPSIHRLSQHHEFIVQALPVPLLYEKWPVKYLVRMQVLPRAWSFPSTFSMTAACASEMRL